MGAQTSLATGQTSLSSKRRGGGGNIRLVPSRVDPDADVGDLVGTIVGAGITSLTLIDDDGGKYALDGNDVKVAAAIAEGSDTIVIRAVFANGWQRDFSIPITVAQGGGVVVPTNFQVVTTHNGLPVIKYPGTTSGRSDVQLQMRTGHFLGAAGVKRWKIGQGAYVSPQNNNVGDQALGNGFNYEVAIERVTGGALAVHGQFSGVNTVDIADKAALVLSDEIALVAAGDTEIFSQQGFILAAAAQNFAQSIRAGQDGSRVLSPLTASLIGSTGAFAPPAGGISTSVSDWPLVLGIPDVPQIAVLVKADSLGEGVGDTAPPFGSANAGPYRQAFWGIDGHRVPYDFHAIPGRSFAGDTPVTSPNTRVRWQYCTHVIMALSRNSVGLGFAGMKAAATALINELRATIGPYGKRLHVTVKTMPPSTASASGNWTSAVDQTAPAGFGNGETRDQYNAWVLAGCDGLADDIIDTNSVVEDPTDHTKFVSNGTNKYATGDGTHLTSIIYTMEAAIIANWYRRQVPIPAF